MGIIMGHLQHNQSTDETLTRIQTHTINPSVTIHSSEALFIQRENADGQGVNKRKETRHTYTQRDRDRQTDIHTERQRSDRDSL